MANAAEKIMQRVRVLTTADPLGFGCRCRTGGVELRAGFRLTPIAAEGQWHAFLEETPPLVCARAPVMGLEQVVETKGGVQIRGVGGLVPP